MPLIPNAPLWSKRRLLVTAPDEFRGSKAMARKLGSPEALPDSMRDEFFEIVKASNGLCGLKLSTAEDDKRGDIEVYGVERLPEKLGKAGYADYEDGRELVVVELGVADREEAYRRALYRHELGHALKLHHSESDADSVMVPGLKREGEDDYPGGWRDDDLATLRALYGEP